MSINQAYIFPNILPAGGLVFPLAQLFTHVLFLRPVEDDLPEADTPLLRALASQPAGQGPVINYSCPAPLSQDRDGFLALLRDIRSRPEDYAGHLGYLSAGSVPVVQEEEREHSIIDTLLQQTGIRARPREHTPEAGKGQGKKEKNVSHLRLWQARMLLKLGEAVDIQQADIRNNLARMSYQQEELLRTLRRAEEEGEPAFDLPTIIPDEEMPLKQQRLRLKAWSRLFALSENDVEHTVFISQHAEAVEALIEQYQQEASCTLTPFLTLPLPVHCPEGVAKQDFVGQDALLADLLAKRDDFQEEASALLASIREFWGGDGDGAGAIDSHRRGEREQKEEKEQQEQQWIDLLDRYYPATVYGRCTLTLYFLPEASPQHFFLTTFAPHDQSQGTGTGMLLGFLAR